MVEVDVAIIGGGPAGLTAAATLARQLHTAVVFDSGTYRNGTSHHIHTVPGWDHKDPREFRDTTRSQITSNYDTIQFADVEVTKIEKRSDSEFLVLDASGKTWTARKIILALGCKDIFPEIEGYRELWMKKIYHCLFCLGYEDRGAKASGVLAVQAAAMVPALALHSADNAAQLSQEVTVFTNGAQEVTDQVKVLAKDSPFKIDDREISRLEDTADNSVTIHFKKGTSQQLAFLVHNPLTAPQGPFVEQLGLEMSPSGDIKADAPMYQTSSRGVFAAGDCITPFKVIPHAIASGNFAAVAAATQLQAEKYKHVSMV